MSNNPFINNLDILSLNITTISGEEINLFPNFLYLEIFENLFEQFLTAKCIIADTSDLVTNIPLVGNEKITMEISSINNNSLTLNFKLYKIDRDSEIMGGLKNRKFLVLYLCSDELIKNNERLSRKYSGHSETIISDILSNVYNSNKTLNSDTTSNEVDVVSNFWKPSFLIDYLCKNSKTEKYSDMIFFETLHGFNFKSISQLMSENPRNELKIADIIDSLANSNIIESFRFESFFDLMQAGAFGFFGGTYYSPHKTNYINNVASYDYVETQENYTSLGSQGIFDESLSNSNNINELIYTDSQIKNIRGSIINLLMFYNIVVSLNGDLSRRCGDIIELKFPVFDGKTIINKSFNGRFLITAIKHIIGRNSKYKQNMIITKNAFSDRPELPIVNELRNI